MSRAATILFAACLALAACDDDTAAAADLASPVDDLAVPVDLAAGPDFAPIAGDMVRCTYPPDAFGPGPDAAGFCDGTPLTGTCAQAFFERVLACYHPAGCCQRKGSNTVYVTWESGAYYELKMGAGFWSLSQGGQECAHTTDVTGDPLHWFAFDGSDLPYFDPGSGELHCPDGTQLNVGAYAQCADLMSLLRPGGCAASCCVPYPL